MIDKAKQVLNSVRFWQLTVGLIVMIIAYYKVIPEELAQMIAAYLGLSITVRTVDKFQTK